MRLPVPVQETSFCQVKGCDRRVRRPSGAASLCAAGHEIPASREGLELLSERCAIQAVEERPRGGPC